MGMQKLGKIAEEGFSRKDLQTLQTHAESQGLVTELVDLESAWQKEDKSDHKHDQSTKDALVLVIRRGIDMFLAPVDHKALHEHLKTVPVDKKALIRREVKHKRARYNVCYGKNSQEPDYANGKGRIVSFQEVPPLQKIRDLLPNVLGNKATKLNAELNDYYDINKCGIGFHGDTERRLVIGFRFGADMKLRFQWYLNTMPVGNPAVTLTLCDGDMYVMSSKAVGSDWLSRSFPTLRHAAGAEKYLTPKNKKQKVLGRKRNSSSITAQENQKPMKRLRVNK